MDFIKISDLKELPKAAEQFINLIGNRKVFALYGSMGAGKTTFIKEICEQLGVKEPINSPTFAIINEYSSRDGAPIFHFDFYRIKNLDEAKEIGTEDYFYSGNLCFIEWPELVSDLLPYDTVKVTIEEQSDGSRNITVS